jgi:hypothetical protein
VPCRWEQLFIIIDVSCDGLVDFEELTEYVYAEIDKKVSVFRVWPECGQSVIGV